MTNTNVAVICLSKINGGMELAAVKLARLLSSDVRVDFIAKKDSYIDKYSDNKFDEHGIKLHTISFNQNFSFHLMKRLREIVIDREIKNIIYLGAKEMKSLGPAMGGLDINFIIRQGSKKTTSKKDFFHKFFYKDVNYFIGNSDWIKQNIIDIFPVPKDAIVSRIYSSLKLESNIKQHIFNGVINIVLVGRIHPGKGQFLAIKACEVLYENGIDFNLKFLGNVQDKKYNEEMQSYLENCKHKDSVEFVGYTNDIKSYLLDSDIFLFPSLGEGMSNAIIEALGYGLIPIIYDDTSSPEFKKLGFHLHLTEENTLESLKNHLLNVVENLDEEKKNASKNIALAQSVFSPDRERNEYLELLD